VGPISGRKPGTGGTSPSHFAGIEAEFEHELSDIRKALRLSSRFPQASKLEDWDRTVTKQQKEESKLPNATPVSGPQVHDTNDEMVLETAINGDAAPLVTYSTADFSVAAERFGIPVLTPAQLLKKAKP